MSAKPPARAAGADTPSQPRRAFGHIKSLATLCVTGMLLAALASPPALAQSRPIPDDSKRGVISHIQDMLVKINGTPMRLAPGANIRDRNNFIIVPSALPAGGALADYTVDAGGQVFRVWLLTDEEAKRPKKKRAAQ